MAMLRQVQRSAGGWTLRRTVARWSRALSSSSLPLGPSQDSTGIAGLASDPSATDPSDVDADPDALDALLGRQVQQSAAATSQDMLPALKVLSESLGLMRESPAFQNWSATDWLMGLTVLAHHNTMQQRRRRVKTVRFKKQGRRLDSHVLLPNLLRYVRVCDAVYAGSTKQFCLEAGVDEQTVVRSHSGGVFSPKYVLLLDHTQRELVLVVRGSASILDFCTDLCLINEAFRGGEGHRGMVHAANWLVRHVRKDLADLTTQYPDYALITTGHSLGAGVAALAAMALKPTFPSVHCYAFATPASVTRELAEECHDYVTSVVNGDDCVPRLHQHSMLRLQNEISQFDWRTTLRQLVAEEVEDQKIELRKQKEARLNQIQSAFRKLERVNRKQIDEAAAKLNSVKQVATQNILELSNDVDKLLADTVDAAFASFKTDKLTVDHISFMKKLISLDTPTAKDRMWWTRLDDTMLLLERLSGVVKKPEELDRVVKELKGLLRSPHSSSDDTFDSDDDKDASGVREAVVSLVKQSDEQRSSDEATQLDLFRRRLDDVVSRTSGTVKETIKEQVSKVSDSVVSNVSEYVDLVKEEAEALSARVQGELDAVQDQVTQRASSMFSVAENTLQFDASSAAEQDPVKSTASGATTPLEPEEKPKRRKLLHAPLFPPGRILYLNRVLVDPASGERVIDERQSAGDADSGATTPVELMEVGNDEFSRVVLSHQMILDHLCTTYERMLQEIQQGHDTEKSNA